MSSDLILRETKFTQKLKAIDVVVNAAGALQQGPRDDLVAVHIDAVPFIARTAAVVVIADMVFTAVAALVQPITGVLLARTVGWSLTEPWLLASIVLYLLVGAFWLPVVAIQIRLRDLARQAEADGTALTERYFTLIKVWIACGIAAFTAMLVLFFLMVARPVLW